MWMLIVIVCLSIGGSFEDYECSWRAQTKCNKLGHPYLPPDFDIENIMIACQETQTLLRCYIDEEKKCGNFGKETNDYAHILNYLQNICQTDSEIYKVISNNLECMKDNAYFSCDDTQEIRNKLKLEKTQSGRKLNTMCQELIHYTACVSASMINPCGESVAQATLEVLLNTSLPPYCSEDVTDIVTDTMESIYVADLIKYIDNEIEQHE